MPLPQKTRLLILLIAAYVCFSANMLTASAEGSTSGTPSDDIVDASRSELESRASGTPNENYWTKERMEQAIPLDMPVAEERTANASNYPSDNSKLTAETIISHPVFPEEHHSPDKNATVPSTAGKVFFKRDGKNYVCSGSAVASPRRHMVVTAGHCVHSGKNGTWSTKVVFVPAYCNGHAPYGRWNYTRLVSYADWVSQSNWTHDQGFIIVEKRNGKNLVDTVGGNGMVFGASQSQTNVRIWGWPEEAPYTGKIAFHCDGNTSKVSLFSKDMRMGCSMTGGASGGPWLKSRINADLGYVFGVTSRRTLSGTPYLLSTPFDSGLQSIFNQYG